MHIGDALEVLGAFALAGAAYIWSGTVLALAVAGVALLYFAQVYAEIPVRLPRIRRSKTSALDGSAIWRCDKCGGEHYLGLQAGHVCRAEA